MKKMEFSVCNSLYIRRILGRESKKATYLPWIRSYDLPRIDH